MSQTIRIATRKTALALWQARHVKSGLEQAHPELYEELKDYYRQDPAKYVT